MKTVETAPNGMTKIVDASNGLEVFFNLEDLLYITFDSSEQEPRQCQIGIRGTDFWIKASAEDGRALLRKKRKRK